ncbi:MAG: alanine/glycine:cation symporter family protein [Bacteroidales bacterium]|nr:alanine/glycine:cation symporter family protein [Bacteroidales bacterium]
MTNLWTSIENSIISFSSFLGTPLVILLIGGGLFFMIYSRFTPFRYYLRAIKSLREKEKDPTASGQISSFEALTSAIAATVGMGSISGVAVAITMGGPGAIFWMWVSATLGMATKFFEGTLAIMYKDKDTEGELQGGAMYMITKGLGEKWRPMAVFFSIFGLVGTLCLWQSNQLTEAITSVLSSEAAIESTFFIKLIIGVIVCLIVSIVILGGIKKISRVSSKLVPTMVALYFILVTYIILTNLPEVPAVFASIFAGAFNFEAGVGGLAGTAIIIGVRRATLVNEAGVGTASMMHGASKNSEPVKEGLVAMIGPSIDSGLVCTLTALAILINSNYDMSQTQGIDIAMSSFEKSIPGIGHYLLMFMVTIFAFSTMFSYSYYGVKCTSFLFGAKYGHYYNYFFLFMLIVGAVVSLDVVVGIVDSAFALMAFPTMISMFILAPGVRREMKKYFAK